MGRKGVISNVCGPMWTYVKWSWRHEAGTRMMIGLIGASIVAPIIYMGYAANYVYRESVSATESPKYLEPEEISDRRKTYRSTMQDEWCWYKPITWSFCSDPNKSTKAQ